MTVVETSDALSLVEGEVRELVRRRGLDPVTQPGAVRRLVEEVVADYEDRALSGPLPALGERAAISRHVYDAVVGLGPLQRYLNDPTVEKVRSCSNLGGGSLGRGTDDVGRCGLPGLRRGRGG